MEEFSAKKLIADFNHGAFRRRSIPQELVSGWPCLRQMGECLCMTIPYYARAFGKEKVALYPLYCSATLPIGNPDRLMDFTIYRYLRDWADIDYSRPAGYFKHEALEEVRTRDEYRALCDRLYGCFDAMVSDIRQGRPFSKEEEMTALFSKLMEPGHYPQYLRVNERFYAHFCRLNP